jgi:RNA polymerase sigma factor (sigma-70 family)
LDERLCDAKKAGLNCGKALHASLEFNRQILANQHRHNTLTDDELLQRYRHSGDNEWLGILLQRYTLLLLGVAMKYLKEKDSAEDAVQHVFYQALTHFPDEEMQNFKGWLYVLTRNYCLQQLRKSRVMDLDTRIESIAIASDTIDELRWKEYSIEQMNEALKELNDTQRETVVMFYLQKLSYQQIMERTGYTYMQVKSFIQNGKRNLKMILTKKLGNRQP